MHKYAALAVAAAAALLASSASAADRDPDAPTVRIPVAGKTQAQLQREIDVAARSVCESMSRDLPEYRACVGQAVSEGQRQLRGLTLESAAAATSARD